MARFFVRYPVSMHMHFMFCIFLGYTDGQIFFVGTKISTYDKY